MKRKNEKILGKNIAKPIKKEILSSKIDEEFDVLKKTIQEYFKETVVKIKKASENNMDI